MPSKGKPVSKTKKDARRLHILYKGRVQGVGFRYTAEKIALDAGLTGWVRNLPDGDVELLAEGAEKTLQTLIEQIQASPVGRHIKKAIVDWQECRDEFDDFRVEFCY